MLHFPNYLVEVLRSRENLKKIIVYVTKFYTSLITSTKSEAVNKMVNNDPNKCVIETFINIISQIQNPHSSF